jgi:predicted nucleic acid-binding protein
MVRQIDMSRILLDANILVYAFDESVVFHKKAAKVLTQEVELFITQSSLLEFYRVMTSKPFRKNIPWQDMRLAMKYCSEILNVLYPTQITDSTLSHLIEEYKPQSGQIWDYLLYAQALENRINTIYTKNTKHFPKTEFVDITDPTL